MTVKDLIKQLLDFNPDANIQVSDLNGNISDFSLAWGAFEGEGITKDKTNHVFVYTDPNKKEEKPEEECKHDSIEEIQGGQIERCRRCGKQWGG